MKPFTTTLALVISLWVLYLSQPIYSADSTISTTELQQQLQKLRTENEALKQENQVLRKLVFEKQHTSQNSVNSQPQTSSTTNLSGGEKPAATSRQPIPDNATQGYWMTNSSGKRHNSSCRYFHTSNGHPCGPNDGIPCKICGG
jgi:regulator of replication initiation timing